MRNVIANATDCPSAPGELAYKNARFSNPLIRSNKMGHYIPRVDYGWLGLFRPGESKGGEESNGKLPHNAACQEQSGTYCWFPDA
ncbi:hypothetical protein PoB_004456500 [Plakobranchus ocellatus]|uniref:Uncharacterized protein n=1 Tax=Plakobranchus ocellatus TaxID=259542 RepID=A0AAV4BG29_9GAST|nr:hypothetical protein PoB_004456500 [Plakobranchus ocellatus]